MASTKVDTVKRSSAARAKQSKPTAVRFRVVEDDPNGVSVKLILGLLEESDSLLKESVSLREHTERTLRRAEERISRLR